MIANYSPLVLAVLPKALIEAGHFSNTEDIIEISVNDETLGFTMEARLAGAKYFQMETVRAYFRSSIIALFAVHLLTRP